MVTSLRNIAESVKHFATVCRPALFVSWESELVPLFG